VCFAALGLAVSSLIRSAESAGPIANASYLPIAIVSGIFDPTMGLPHWLSYAADVLPVKALAQVLEDAYPPGRPRVPRVGPGHPAGLGRRRARRGRLALPLAAVGRPPCEYTGRITSAGWLALSRAGPRPITASLAVPQVTLLVRRHRRC
jgi:hypothetical protein